MAERIKEQVTASLDPVFIDVTDESAKHGGQHAYVITVVSSKFVGLSLIEKHRLVNEVLADHLDAAKGGTVHMLQIKAKTPE